MVIIVTGGMGFIGANIVHALHRESFEIVVVDNLEQGDKFINLAGVPILDYCDKRDFLNKFHDKYWGKIDAVFHQGACSSTVERDGRYMMDNNYLYSKKVLDICQTQRLPLIYASSAAVYGLTEVCREDDDQAPSPHPLNVYGYSKWLFDQAVRRFWKETPKSSPIVGLRYFNVYGPHEQHKGRMASVPFHLFQQLKNGKPMQLFDGWAGYSAGEQKRDFIHVDDVVAVNMFFLQSLLGNQNKSGIYNCGSGVAQAFSAIPRALLQSQSGSATAPSVDDMIAQQQLMFIPFPNDLKGRYQNFTQADLSLLRRAGFKASFKSIEQGVKEYGVWLSQH